MEEEIRRFFLLDISEGGAYVQWKTRRRKREGRSGTRGEALRFSAGEVQLFKAKGSRKGEGR
jgi:hypothetical protein